MNVDLKWSWKYLFNFFLQHYRHTFRFYILKNWRKKMIRYSKLYIGTLYITVKCNKGVSYRRKITFSNQLKRQSVKLWCVDSFKTSCCRLISNSFHFEKGSEKSKRKNRQRRRGGRSENVAVRISVFRLKDNISHFK